MKCEEARKYIYPLLDNELDTEKNLNILSHLNMCERCQERFEVEREFLDKLSDTLSSREAPESLRNQVVSELNEKRRSLSWVERLRNKLREGLPVAAAAMFLFAIGLVGYMNIYLNKNTSPASLVKYLPEINREIVESNRNRFGGHDISNPFYEHEALQKKLARTFPALKSNIDLPTLKGYRCLILDGKVMEKGMKQIREPFFYTLYCIHPEKEHRLVTHLVLKRSWFSPDRLNLPKDRVTRSGKFTVVELPDSSSKLVYWGNKEYVCAFVSDQLDRDTLVDLARDARNQSISFRKKHQEAQ